MYQPIIQSYAFHWQSRENIWMAISSEFRRLDRNVFTFCMRTNSHCISGRIQNHFRWISAHRTVYSIPLIHLNQNFIRLLMNRKLYSISRSLYMVPAHIHVMIAEPPPFQELIWSRKISMEFSICNHISWENSFEHWPLNTLTPVMGEWKFRQILIQFEIQFI